MIIFASTGTVDVIGSSVNFDKPQHATNPIF